jgi:hypothetical protein
MSWSAYQWRVDGGYLSPPVHQPAMLFKGMPPPPYIAVPAYGPSGFVPIPTPGAMIPRYVAAPPAHSRPHPPPPPAQNVVAKVSSKKANPNRPPALRPGMNYMFSPEHTHLHVIGKAIKIWREQYRGRV